MAEGTASCDHDHSAGVFESQFFHQPEEVRKGGMVQVMVQGTTLAVNGCSLTQDMWWQGL